MPEWLRAFQWTPRWAVCGGADSVASIATACERGDCSFNMKHLHENIAIATRLHDLEITPWI